MKVTSTSLRFLCNMAQMHIEEAKSMTRKVSLVDKWAPLENGAVKSSDGTKERWRHQQSAISKENLARISDYLDLIARMNGFCAFGRQYLANRDAEISALTKSVYRQDPMPELPELHKTFVFESEAEEMTFNACEARAAAYGVFIHASGAFDEARKEYYKYRTQFSTHADPSDADYMIVDSGSRNSSPSAIVVSSPYTKEDVEAAYRSLQSEYMGNERKLNKMKAKLSTRRAILNSEISAKRAEILREYNAEQRLKENEYNAQKQLKLVELTKAMVVIPPMWEATARELQKIYGRGDASED